MSGGRGVSVAPPHVRLGLLLWLCVSVAGLVTTTRIPLAQAHFFSFDEANFAWALEDFDPRLHQPQPPGYPLFVVQARLLQRVFITPEQTFLACGLIAGIAAPVLLYLLGMLMFSRWCGLMAALLLIVNPAFWRSTLVSPLRPYLAVVCLAVAYCCWRAVRGESRFAYWGALALGLGAGWRPSLLVLLFPLWLICSWRSLRSLSRWLVAFGVLSLAVLVWLMPLTAASGGAVGLWHLLSNYLSQESQMGSPVYGSGFWGWWKMLAQGFVWNALAFAGWFWAAFVLMFDRSGPSPLAPRDGATQLSPGMFVALWTVPFLLFFFTIHVDSPGQTLSVIPAWCLLGGAYLEAAAKRVGRWTTWTPPRIACLALALALNVLFFLYPFRNPNPRPPFTSVVPQALEQLRYWGAFGLYRTGYQRIRQEELRTGERIRLVRALGRSPDVALVWQDDDVSWRKLTYYFSDRPTWVLQGISGPAVNARPLPRLWLGRQMVVERPGDGHHPLLLSGKRVVWMLHRHSPLPAALRAQGVPLKQFGTVYLSDLSAAPQRFQAGPFSFSKAADPN